MTTSPCKYNNLTARIGKTAPSKVYDYIRKVEIDGYPRVRAYAEAIDPMIYDLTPSQIGDRLDYLQTHYPGYKELKESVLAENKDWSLRKSVAIQNKAVDLLNNLLDKANQIATDPNTDVKELSTAISTLKAVMPAFTAVSNNASRDINTTDKKTRAGKFIN